MRDYRPDHIIARVFYARVLRSPDIRTGRGHCMDCLDLVDRTEFSVNGQRLVESFVSADTWDDQKEVTKTAMAEKLVNAGVLPFTVCFVKSRGQERVLRGRLVEHENLLGRSMVLDFDVAKGSPLREVDHRTLKWLILDGVKYVLK